MRILISFLLIVIVFNLNVNFVASNVVSGRGDQSNDQENANEPVDSNLGERIGENEKSSQQVKSNVPATRIEQQGGDKCLDGWESDGGERCLKKFLQESVTSSEASTRCDQLNGKVLVLESKSLLPRFADEEKSYWVQIRGELSEPNKCDFVNDGNVEKGSCGQKKGYVCQWTRCIEGWEEDKEHKCVKTFFDHSFTFNDANVFCGKMNARVIEFQTKNSAENYNSQKETNFWVQLKGEVNEVNQCNYVKTMTIDKAPCDQKKGVICEWISLPSLIKLIEKQNKDIQSLRAQMSVASKPESSKNQDSGDVIENIKSSVVTLQSSVDSIEKKIASVTENTNEKEKSINNRLDVMEPKVNEAAKKSTEVEESFKSLNAEVRSIEGDFRSLDINSIRDRLDLAQRLLKKLGEDIDLKLPVLAKIAGTDETMRLRENESMSLLCEVTGNPKPKIVWKFNGHIIPNESNERLVLSSVNVTNLGKYECIAMNPLVESVSKLFDVIVDYKPIVTTKLNHTRINYGHNLTLSCEFRSNGEVTVNWMMNRSKSVPSSFYKTESNRTILTIDGATKDRIGDYECFVKNELGEGSQLIKVDGYTPKELKVDVNQTDALNNYNLTFAVKSDETVTFSYTLKLHNLPLKTIHLYKEVASKDGIFYANATLRDLEFGSYYELTVTAANIYGITEHKRNLSVPHVCADGKEVTAKSEWQYLVSHKSFGYEAMSKSECEIITSNNATKLTIEVVEVSLNEEGAKCPPKSFTKIDNVDYNYVEFESFGNSSSEFHYICGRLNDTRMANEINSTLIVINSVYDPFILNDFHSKTGFKLRFKQL